MKRKRLTALFMAAAMVLTMPAEAVVATDLEFTDVSAEEIFLEDVETEVPEAPVAEEITDVEEIPENAEVQVFSDDVTVDVFGSGGESEGGSTGGVGTEEGYSLDFDDYVELLPDWDYKIGNEISCVNGELATVTGVTVGAEGVVTCEAEADGWKVKAGNALEATTTLTVDYTYELNGEKKTGTHVIP